MIVKEISIKDIEAGENIRQLQKEENLASLMQTIKDNGLLQPIGVKEIADFRYKIMWGNRRLSACKKLGHKTINAVIYSQKDDEMTEEDFIVVNGIENLQQSPNTLYEIGRICTILKKTMSISEISARLGIPKKRVQSALDEIKRIPSKWQRKVKLMDRGEEKKGYIPITHAVRVASLRGLSKEKKDKLFEHISKNDVSIDRVGVIGSLMQSGKEIKTAVKEVDKYSSHAVSLFYDKPLLDKLLNEKYESMVDLVLDCINSKYPNLAIRRL